jgi:hypothetical protein
VFSKFREYNETQIGTKMDCLTRLKAEGAQEVNLPEALLSHPACEEDLVQLAQLGVDIFRYEDSDIWLDATGSIINKNVNSISHLAARLNRNLGIDIGVRFGIGMGANFERLQVRISQENKHSRLL